MLCEKFSVGNLREYVFLRASRQNAPLKWMRSVYSRCWEQEHKFVKCDKKMELNAKNDVKIYTEFH